MEYVTLCENVRMPLVGIGIYSAMPTHVQPLVKQAIELGFSYFETAQAYGLEEYVGQGLAVADVARDQLFVVDKVRAANYGAGTTLASVKESLRLLGCDYLDVVLLHQAEGDVWGAWEDLECAHDEGLVRALGVANFTPEEVAQVAAAVRVAPVVCQVELHPFCQQQAERAALAAAGVMCAGWAPFAEGVNGFYANPVLADIAAMHGRTVAQVALRWLVELGVPCAPRAVRPQRMEELLDVFNWSLTPHDHERLTQLDTGASVLFSGPAAEALRVIHGGSKRPRGGGGVFLPFRHKLCPPPRLAPAHKAGVRWRYLSRNYALRRCSVRLWTRTLPQT